MKHHKLIGLLAAVFFTGIAFSQPVKLHGQLSVKGIQFVDKNEQLGQQTVAQIEQAGG